MARLIEFKRVFHAESQGWVIMEGHDPDNPDYPTHTHFPRDVFEWRIAEYGLADDDHESAFKMFFSDALLSMVDGLDDEIDVDHPIPAFMTPADARMAKVAHMAQASAGQNKRLARGKVSPSADRVNLFQETKDLLGGLTQPRGLEHKKLLLRAGRETKNYADQTVFEQAIRAFEMGDAGTVEEAITLGIAETQRRMPAAMGGMSVRAAQGGPASSNRSADPSAG